MTKVKSTKQALLTSMLALLLCVSMLVGTTFAWFTDSVTSSDNKIVAGTLDVQLLMNTGNGYKDISDSTDPIFGTGSIAQNNNMETLWEPGKTQVAYLAIKNNGNLALKYTVDLNVENIAKDLYKAMNYTITPDAQYGSVKKWDATIAKAVVIGTQTVSETVSLAAGDTHYFALSIHMDELAGNEYQAGEVNFDLTVMATQNTVEEDSFNNQYDKDSMDYDVVVTNAEELYSAVETVDDNAVIAIDGNIVLTKNLSKSGLNSIQFVAVNDNATIDQATYNMSFSGAKVTFDGLTLTHGEKTYGNGGQASTSFAVWDAKEVNYIDCTFNRSVGTLHASVHNFIGCIFNGVYNPDNALSEYPLNNYDSEETNVIDCVFNCTNRGAILFYGDNRSGEYTLNISNTNFLGDIIADKTAVEIHSLGESIYNVNIENVIVGDGIINGLYRIKSGNEGTVNVKVDTDSVVTNAHFISTADELIALGGKSVEGTIILTDDIDLNGAEMSTIGAAYGKKLTVMGNGHTISNGKSAHTNHNGMKHHGLFYAYEYSNLTISDLVIDNFDIDATKDTERNYGVGVVVAYMDGYSNVTLDNVDVKNCDVLNNTPNIGDEAGVYVGYQTGTLIMVDCDSTGCSVVGETVEKTGAFIGMVNGTATLTNCTTDLTIGTCNRVSGTLTEN